MESDDVPSVITAFYDKLNYVTAEDGKVKLVGHGKKWIESHFCVYCNQ